MQELHLQQVNILLEKTWIVLPFLKTLTASYLDSSMTLVSEAITNSYCL